MLLPEAVSELVNLLLLALTEASHPLFAFATVQQSKYAAARTVPLT